MSSKAIYFFLFLLFLFFPFGQLLRIEVFKYININLFDIPVFLIACSGLLKWRTSLFKINRLLLSPFAENHGRNPMDECEEFSASEGFRSRRSEGRRYPERKLAGASYFLFICIFTLSLGSLTVNRDVLLEGFLYFFRFLTYFCFYLSLIKLFKDNNLSNYAKNGLLISGTAFTLIGICQYIFFPDLRVLAIFGWDDHYYRLTGLFFDPGFMGILLVFFIIYLLDRSLKTNTNYLFISFVLIATLALALTFSRSSYLALITSVLSFSYLQKKIVLPVVILICFALFVNFAPKRSGEGVNLERTSTVYSRFENYVQSERLILENPLFGIGFNLFPAFSEGGLHSRRGVDSSLLFVAITTGIIGLLIYLSWFFTLLSSAYKARSGLLFGSLVAILTHSLFQNSLFYSWVLVWLFIIIALEVKENM